MIRPKAAYFFYFAAGACLLPFLALYYAQNGMSASQIGLLSGLLPLVTLVSAPLWGGLADATQRHRPVLLLAMAGSIVVVVALSQTSGLRWLIPLVILNAFFLAPVIPLVDNTVLTMLGDRKSLYGRQRIGGAFGWGLMAPVAGWLIDRTGMSAAFGGYALLMLGCLVTVAGLPVERASGRGSYWRGVMALLRNGPWVIFLASILIGGLALSIEMSFLFLYMEQLGASKTLMGITLAVSTVSELPVWFFADRLIERLGTRKVLALSLLACAVQGFGYSLMTNPLVALPIQLLHGLAFSASWAAGVALSGEIAPKGMGATAQGVFGAVSWGVRAMLGSVLGGLLFEYFGPAAAFRWGGVAALVGIGFLWVASRRTEAR
ncbi:MAG: major facilitator superfamily domain-containing protein 6 [Anaerolineae bacterium]